MADISGFNVGGQYVSPELYGIYEKQTHTGKVSGLLVKQNTTPNMTVLVEPGIALLDKGSFSSVVAGVKSNTSLTIATANPSNPRIDAIVVYEDIAVTMPSVEPYSVDASNGRFKLVVVAGTPGAVPTAPSDPTIQSTIGAGNTSWTRLATVRVEAGTTTIVNSKIDNTIRSSLGSLLAPGQVTNAKLSTTTGEIGGAWTTWTPTWTNLTVGSGAVVAKYQQVGKTVRFRLLFRLGSGSSVGTNPSFTLPVTAIDYGNTSTGKPAIGHVHFEDNGTATIMGFVDLTSSTTARPLIYNAAGTYVGINAMDATVPFTWAAGDEIMATGTYEAA